MFHGRFRAKRFFANDRDAELGIERDQVNARPDHTLDVLNGCGSTPGNNFFQVGGIDEGTLYPLITTLPDRGCSHAKHRSAAVHLPAWRGWLPTDSSWPIALYPDRTRE